MKIGESYLLSFNELSLIAAASGMNSFLMFSPKGAATREEQLQSVFRLMNDGLLISKNKTIVPNPSLVPLLKTLQQASTAVIAKLPSGEAVPLCVYYNEHSKYFLRIAPHKFKKDFFEVGIVDQDTLLEEFESLSFLPTLYEEALNEENIPLASWEDNDPTLLAIGNTPLATFEKFNLSRQELLEKASIIQTPFSWWLSVESTIGVNHTLYTHHSFITWLKGVLK